MKAVVASVAAAPLVVGTIVLAGLLRRWHPSFRPCRRRITVSLKGCVLA